MQEKKELDSVFPFQIDQTLVTGRYVRLERALTNILTQHTYPDFVNQLMAELILAGALLASIFKYNGTFTIQIKGTLDISFIVAEVTSQGAIRACAKVKDNAKFAGVAKPPLQEAFGKGLLVFSVDQGGDTDLYQGIVELKGSSVQEALNHYFHQSEQTALAVKLLAAKTNNTWQGLGIVVNHVAALGGKDILNAALDEKIWGELPTRLDKISPAFLQRAPRPNLETLFEGTALTIQDPSHFQAKCRCSRPRIVELLRTFPKEETDAMKINGIIEVVCEFCNQPYHFAEKDFRLALVPESSGAKAFGKKEPKS